MNIIIVGAGISGLSAAISLRHAGHRVTIYERSSLNNEIGAAINVPPNASRILIPWGLDSVKSKFVTCDTLYFVSPTTLDVVDTHDHSHDEEKFGQPLYYAHRVDLHEALKELAVGEKGPGLPVVIRLGCNVQGLDPGIPSITLQDGTVIPANLVVGADGINSIATEVVLGKAHSPVPGKILNCCYRFLISTAELEADPETKWLTQGEQHVCCRLYADPARRRRLVVYNCRDREIYNFVALCYNEKMLSKQEDWHASVDKTEVLNICAGYHPKLLAVINKATHVKRWPLLYRPPIHTWHRGRMILTGDAAHPMLPHHAQAAAQAIEDGAALGLVMHGVTSPSQIEERLLLYEKIRLRRAATIQILSNSGFDETPPEEIEEFLEGENRFRNMRDVLQWEHGDDVVERTIKVMKEFDPEWTVPEGFFLVGNNVSGADR